MKKTLQQIKDEYAIELGYRDFKQITGERSVFVIESILDEVAIRYAQEQKTELVANIQLLIQSLDYDALGVMS